MLSIKSKKEYDLGPVLLTPRRCQYGIHNSAAYISSRAVHVRCWVYIRRCPALRRWRAHLPSMLKFIPMQAAFKSEREAC
jgi:hypothetical protein